MNFIFIESIFYLVYIERVIINILPINTKKLYYLLSFLSLLYLYIYIYIYIYKYVLLCAYYFYIYIEIKST